MTPKMCHSKVGMPSYSALETWSVEGRASPLPLDRTFLPERQLLKQSPYHLWPSSCFNDTAMYISVLLAHNKRVVTSNGHSHCQMTQRQQNRSCSLAESAASVNVIEAAMTCSLAIVEKFCNENTAICSLQSTVLLSTATFKRELLQSQDLPNSQGDSLGQVSPTTQVLVNCMR